MEFNNGAQTVMTVPGRQVIVSAGKGKTNIEELRWLTNTVLQNARAWKATGWAYVADCSSMEPVSMEESQELITMTKAFVDNGCKAFGFAEGSSIMLKVQTQQNTQMSKTGIPEGHFATVDEALNWVKEDVNL